MKTSANDWATRQRIETERAAWVAEHGPACQICGTVPKTRGLQWDHDHKTKAHRGWLCWRCNRALPTWVTVRWLFQAALYLLGGRDQDAPGDPNWNIPTDLYMGLTDYIDRDAEDLP